MDESHYQQVAYDTLKRIERLFDDVDPDVVDCQSAGDVLTLSFSDGKRCVINTQRPTRQIWLAADARAWHFDYDGAASEWRDDKDPSVELFAKVSEIVETLGGVDLED